MKTLYILRITFNTLVIIELFVSFLNFMLVTPVPTRIQGIFFLAILLFFNIFLHARECRHCHGLFPYKDIQNTDEPLVCPYCHTPFDSPKQSHPE